MAKPKGTYLKIQGQSKIIHNAQKDRIIIGSAQGRDVTEFYNSLKRVAVEDLESWHRNMAAISNKMKNDGLMSKDDKTRKYVSGILEQIRELLENVQHYNLLEARLQIPAKTIMKVPSNIGPGGINLAIVIALFQILEVLVRVVKRRK